MNFDTDTFIKNILEHSARIMAIIEATDFNNHSLNPNITLIPSLWNNVNDALIVWAMNTHSTYDECRKKAELILRRAGELSCDAENCLTVMKDLRAIYTSDIPEMEFNRNDCLRFLNAYDTFMYIFYTSCTRVQQRMVYMNIDYNDICSMRGTFLKNIAGSSAATETVKPAPKPETVSTGGVTESDPDNIAELLKLLIKETQRTNELLKNLLAK